MIGAVLPPMSGYQFQLDLLTVDPGPTWMGWAHLRVLHGPGCKTSYMTGGEVLSERRSFMRLLGETKAEAVAIESPAGYIFNQARSPQVMATARIAGGLSWVAEGLGLRVVEATAQQVRQVLAGKANAQDDAVRDVVRANVFHAPEHKNSHVHDAIAMGLVGAWLLLGMRALPVPKPKAAKTKRPGKGARASKKGEGTT